MASKSTCQGAHAVSVGLIDQRNVPFTIHPNNDVEFDHSCCCKCKYKFHHITFGYVCKNCDSFMLCFKCEEPKYKNFEDSFLITWYFNSNNNYTSVALMSEFLDKHQQFFDEHDKKHISAEFLHFKFDFAFTTSLETYFRFIRYETIPEKYEIMKKFY